MQFRIFLLFFTMASVTACGSSTSSTFQCSATTEKNFVLSTARDAYLFLDLLPANVNVSSYATAADLLDTLTATARAQNKDRYFSYLTTAAAEQQFYAQGSAVGFGMGMTLRDSNLYITQVFAGSAAASAGLLRGDEIIAIGTDANTLVTVASLVATNELSNAFGPSLAGVQKTLRVVRQAGTPQDHTLTKGTFPIDPVPEYKLIERTGLPPIGYVNLRSFISPAEEPLRNVFRAFKDAQVMDIIIDVRYNGGGLVTIAETLAELLSTGRAGQTMYSSRFNSRHTQDQSTVLFSEEADAIAGVNIAFITTSATASASELVINILEPYANVALVGARTYGKPVGQYGFDQPGCDVRLRLVTFKHVNRDNEGDFYSGLPDTAFSDTFCPADDDVANPQGDPAEASVSTAVQWINNNTCPTAVAPRVKSMFATSGNAAYPMPTHPTLTQIHLPGTY